MDGPGEPDRPSAIPPVTLVAQSKGTDGTCARISIPTIAGASTSGDSTNTPAYRRLTARKALAEEKGGAGAMELMSIRPPDWAGGLRWIPGW